MAYIVAQFEIIFKALSCEELVICCENLTCDYSDQLPVSTKFDMRSDPGVVRNYGKLLVEMVSVVPDGIVCFFVSYSYMDGIINSWNENGILKVKILFSLSHVSGCC